MVTEVINLKTALVLEGGAMRGMYTCGVLDVFLDFGINFKYVIGVSAGAAFGASYISKQRDRNINIYKKYINDKRYISYSNMLREGSLFGLKFVYEDIPKIHVPFDFDTFYENDCIFYSAVTNIETGETEYFNKSREDANFDVLKATCALPMFSPCIKIGSNKYLDGGITNPIPFDKAFADKNDKAVAVLTQHKGYRKQKQKMLNLIRLKYIKYPEIYKALKIRHELYNRQLGELDDLEKQGKVLIIRPDSPIEFNRIETDLTKLEALYHGGEKDAARLKNVIEEFIK